MAPKTLPYLEINSLKTTKRILKKNRKRQKKSQKIEKKKFCYFYRQLRRHVSKLMAETYLGI